MTPEIEEQISNLVRRSDPTALDLIYEHYGRRLYFYLLALLRSESMAEETLQDLFVTLARKRRKMRNISNLTGYLFSMARNHATDSLRRRRTDEPLANYEAILVSSDERHLVEDREHSRALLHALENLPWEQQEVLGLKIFQELTFADIGRALDISPNTAASRYRYGVSSICAQMRDLIP